MNIFLKVHPKSKKAEVKKIDATHYEVWVREAPEKGRANEAAIRILSEHLGVPPSQLTLVSGRHSKNKILHLNC